MGSAGHHLLALPVALSPLPLRLMSLLYLAALLPLLALTPLLSLVLPPLPPLRAAVLPLLPLHLSPSPLRNATLIQLTISTWDAARSRLPTFHSQFRQVAHGLRGLHAANIAHCDLKTDNCFLTAHELEGAARIVIGDLGASVLIKEDQQSYKANVGTPHCMAPEVQAVALRPRGAQKVHGDIHSNYDPKKSDIWSFGFLLFEIITLEREPYNRRVIEDHEEAISTPVKLTESEIEQLNGFVGQKSLAELVQKCLTFLPKGRPDVEELCEVLDMALTEATKLLGPPRASSAENECACIAESDVVSNRELDHFSISVPMH